MLTPYVLVAVRCGAAPIAGQLNDLGPWALGDLEWLKRTGPVKKVLRKRWRSQVRHPGDLQKRGLNPLADRRTASLTVPILVEMSLTVGTSLRFRPFPSHFRDENRDSHARCQPPALPGDCPGGECGLARRALPRRKPVPRRSRGLRKGHGPPTSAAWVEMRWAGRASGFVMRSMTCGSREARIGATWGARLSSRAWRRCAMQPPRLRAGVRSLIKVVGARNCSEITSAYFSQPLLLASPH